jgi:hypothetical protein
MLLITDKTWMLVAMAGGLCSLGIWPVIWNYVERKGRNSTHIYFDYAATYVVAATVSASTLGTFGHSPSSAPSFFEQLGQRNGPLAAFAILSGCCMGVGDAAMQYSVALLGLSVGPAIINSLIIILGKLGLTLPNLHMTRPTQPTWHAACI